MKLTIEINDDAFKQAVKEQVGKSIAEMAKESIHAQVSEILEKKVERILPDIFKNAQEAMQKSFIKSIGKVPKKKKK